MLAKSHLLGRVGVAVIAVLLGTAASGCAARAEYVHDEPVRYRRARVYRAPPPVIVYREHHHHHHGDPPPRAHRRHHHHHHHGEHRAAREWHGRHRD